MKFSRSYKFEKEQFPRKLFAEIRYMGPNVNINVMRSTNLGKNAQHGFIDLRHVNLSNISFEFLSTFHSSYRQNNNLEKCKGVGLNSFISKNYNIEKRKKKLKAAKKPPRFFFSRLYKKFLFYFLDMKRIFHDYYFDYSWNVMSYAFKPVLFDRFE